MKRSNMESNTVEGRKSLPSNEGPLPARPIFNNGFLLDPAGESNQSHHAGKCVVGVGDEAAPASALPTQRSIDSAQLDWHREMLCGLFLRSDEQELELLEKSVTSQKTSTGLEASAAPKHPPPKSSSPTLKCSSSEKVGDEVAMGGKKEPNITKNTGENKIFPQNQKIVQKQASLDQVPPLNNLLSGLLDLEKTLDCTVLSLIPEALQGLPSMPSSVVQQGKKRSAGDVDIQEHSTLLRGGTSKFTKQSEISDTATPGYKMASVASMTLDDTGERGEDKKSNISNTNLDDPLCIPSSWRRADYARRTLPELEKHIVDSGKGWIKENSTSDHAAKNSKNESDPHHGGAKTYDLFTILYNECSLSAMANWAMLDFSSNEENAEENKEQWQKFKEKEEKRRATDQAQYEVRIPHPTFHLCGICGGFGHYEVECELILDNDKKLGRDETQGGVECSKPSPKKKRKVLDDRGKESVLDEIEKDLIISTLSEEIHVQRRQKQLFDDHCQEMALKPSQIQNMPKQEQKGEDQYTGKSSCCKICHSGLDDGQMLLCDGCDELFHCQCLDPPLDSIPEGDWFCNSCTSYDSDTSSVVELEGCGDFVLEQRKRSVAEEAKLCCGVNLGQAKSLWTTALSILPEQDPIVKDESYLEKHLGREYGHATEAFFVSELCWAKRYNDQFDRVEWWPAMVEDSETRLLKSSKKTTYTVVFFALDEDAEVHETEILPFLNYYEDIGHKRMKIRGDDTFRHALILSVSTLGLKSLGQALKLARSGVQMAAVMNMEDRKLLPPGWKIPVGWESAEIDKIDGIIILAKESSRNKSSPEKLSRKASSSAGSAYTGGALAEDSFESQKMVARFSIDEIIGGIVSWQSDFGAAYSTGDSDIRYGVVASLDTATNMALVRAIPMLSNVSPGHQLFQSHESSDSDILIHATDVGSTTWIPLKHIRFVSGKPARRDLRKFKGKLSSNMKRELESHSEQFKREAKYREQFTIELEDSPQGQYAWS